MKRKQTFDSLDVLYVELTGNCNYDCVHCGNEPNGSKNLEFSLIEKLLDEFNENNGKKLVLTGGEPLLHPQIEDILKLAASHQYHTKISTNTSLLNYAKFAFVLDCDFGFRVSLDGTREIHNQIRKNPGAYDDLISALEKLTEKERQIVIRTTVMRPNHHSIAKMILELDRLTKEERIKIYSNNIWPMRNIGKADFSLMLSASEYGSFLRDLNEQLRGLDLSFRIIAGPTFGLETEFVGGPIQSNHIYRCDLLNTSLHIAYNGDIYPCSFIHYPLGHIAEMSLREVFRSERAVRFKKAFLDRESHDCTGCQVYDSCTAGCIAEKYHQLFSEPVRRVKDVYCFRESA